MDVSPSSLSAAAAAATPKIQWLAGDSAVAQIFPFPYKMMCYMVMPPFNPKAYNTLIKTYIFGNITICPDKNCNGDGKCCMQIDITKISCQLWLTNKVYLNQPQITGFISKLCSKLFRCDAYKIHIKDTYITYANFKSLVTAAKTVKLERVVMTYDNGNPVMLENIIKVIPNLEKFYYLFIDSHCTVNFSSPRDISNLQNIKNLKSFCLSNIPGIQCVDDLFNFIHDHQNAKFVFRFNRNISAEYKAHLNALIDMVIHFNILTCVIEYPGQVYKKRELMHRFYDE